MILFFYFGGCMVLLIRLVGSLWLVRLMKQTSVPVMNPAWTSRLDAWRTRLHVRRRVALITSGHVQVPLAIGWLRPAIVLPPERRPGARRFADRRGPCPRAGPLATRGRRLEPDSTDRADLSTGLIRSPGSQRLIAESREQACDDLCVHWAGGAQSYRMTLLAVAAGLVEGERPRGWLMAAAPISLGMAMAPRQPPPYGAG